MRRSRIVLFCLIVSVLAASRARAGAEMEVYFSPEDECQKRVCAELGQSKKSIDVMMYYFTSPDIADALMLAAKRDVAVRLVLDGSQRELKYSPWRELEEAGIPVHFYGGEGLLHHKVAIIDKKTILGGSYNWTRLASEKNKENLIVVANEELAATFALYFEKLFLETARITENESLTENGRAPPAPNAPEAFITSRGSNVFHTPMCPYARRIKRENRVFLASEEEAQKAGKRPCKKCISNSSHAGGVIPH